MTLNGARWSGVERPYSDDDVERLIGKIRQARKGGR